MNGNTQEVNRLQIVIETNQPDIQILYETPSHQVILVDPRLTTELQNIREDKEDHVIELAKDIELNGQLQECLGAYSETGEIIIIGGRHRRRAVIMLNNKERNEGNPLTPLRVRMFVNPMTRAEMINISIAENKQLPMTPTELSDAIYLVWMLYLETAEDTRTSFADFSRKSGYSPESISNSIKFHKLSPEVANFCREQRLSYRVAVELAAFPNPEDQFMMSVHIIHQGLSLDVALKYIKNTLIAEQPQAQPMFLGMEKAEEPFPITVKRSFGENAQAAEHYFKRILYLLSRHGDRLEKDIFTPGVIDIIRQLIAQSETFKNILENNYPLMCSQIFTQS